MDDLEIQKWAEWLDENDDAGIKANSSDFLEAKDKYAYLQEHKNEIRSIPDAPEIKIPSLDKTVKSLMEDYGNFEDIPEAYRLKMAEEAKVDEKELQNAYEEQKSKQAAKQKVDEEYEGKLRRAKEVENWPWYRKLLSNKYSQQRYIENPDNSIFGDEGSFNPLSTEGQNELRDVILGGAGAVADFIPGVGGVVLGPAARALRGGLNDEKLEDVAKDAALDVGTNIAFQKAFKSIPGAKNVILENARKIVPKKMQTKYPVDEWAETFTVKERQKALPIVNEPPKFKKKSEALKWIQHQPAELRDEYRAAIKDINGRIDTEPAREKIQNVYKDIDKRVTDERNLLRNERKVELGPWEHFAGGIASELPAAVSKTSAHQAAAPKAKTESDVQKEKEAKQKRLGLHKESKAKDYKEQLQQIINDTERQWEAGFEPRAIPGDPTYEAYKMWKRGK